MKIHNGNRFPFGMTEFVGLDSKIFADCLTVIKLATRESLAIHCYIDGGEYFGGAPGATLGFKDHRSQVWR